MNLLFPDTLCPNVSCGFRAYCSKENSSYLCLCEEGFTYNGKSCAGKVFVVRKILIFISLVNPLAS